MPRLLLLTILIVTTAIAQAQVIPRDSLMGAWVCKKTEKAEGFSLSAAEWKIMEAKLKAMLEGSTMLFKKNGLFEWKFPSTAPPEAKEMHFLNSKEWIIDTVTGWIHIGKPSENLMMFRLEQEEGATYLIIDDFPVRMKVEKQVLR
jgi:hypothetical protein